MKESSKGRIHQFPHPTALKHLQNAVPKHAPEEHAQPEPDRYCVYNRSQQRFISTDVVAELGSYGGADACLRNLAPAGRAALWIFPCKEISPTSVRFPLDLVFLNNDCVVLQIIESFPISGASFSGAQTMSLLAFAADTLARGEIRPGDQLIISSPEEMKRQLKRLQDAKDTVPGSIGTDSRHGIDLNTNQQPSVTAGADLQDVGEPDRKLDRSAPSAARENAEAEVSQSAPAEPPAPQAPPAKQDVAERPWVKRGVSRGWFKRVLLGDPPEPRSAPRVAIPGLVAYYFTGGTPKPNEVREISASGLYIITHERWYIGTLVRLTLTDRNNPNPDRSLTVGARVVRAGDDGVGLEFILDGDNRSQEMHMGPDYRTDGVDVNRLMRFIEKLRTR